MNKSSMRLLVAVGLIALLACSWFMLISNTQKANNIFIVSQNNYIDNCCAL